MSNLIQWPYAKWWSRDWNTIIGCKPCSPACQNCWAREWAKRFKQSFEPHCSSKQRPPRKGAVFCGGLSDLFGDWMHPNLDGTQMPVTPEDLIFRADSKKATYIWLTKRVTNMALSLAVGGMTICDDEGETHIIKTRDLDLSNHFFGFTAENQEWYDKRFAELGQRPKWMQWWVSAEPLLGPIDFHFFVRDEVTGEMCIDGRKTPQLVIVGCESGSNRRPCKIEWVESIVDQCRKAGVPVFVKQLDINGVCVTDINKFPEHLRIRQLPECWAKSLKEDSKCK